MHIAEGPDLSREVFYGKFTIGDLHLSFAAQAHGMCSGLGGLSGTDQGAWLSHISPGDTVVLAGDTSWGMTMEEAMPDFLWLEELPGKKLLLKGNHDYWWGSVTSMKRALAERGITSLDFLHNNSFFAEGLNLCGSRGWLFETGERHDEKIIRREAGRIEASLKSVRAGFSVRAFLLHYPPV
jgi:predicted phosphohydrolase